MSPNEQFDQAPDDLPPGGSSVMPLPPRLAVTVARRHALAAQWAESMAHGGPGAEIFQELADLEEAIAEAWPRFWDEHAHDWAIRDAGLIHSEATPTAACRTCTLQSAAWRREAA
jgi:hypothetical protein